MCAMVLADLGARIIRVERPDDGGLGVERPLKFNLVLRGREETIILDLKQPSAMNTALDLSPVPTRSSKGSGRE